MSASHTPIIDAIERIDGAEVHNIQDNYNRVTIDFVLGGDRDMSLYERARSGEWASSVMVDATNDEVVAGTLRYGSMGLPEGADTFVAKVEVEQLAERVGIPGGVASIKGQGPTLFVRWRNMASRGGILREEGDDILHINVRERVDVEAFASWLTEFTRLYRRNLDDIRDKTIEVGASGPDT